MQKKELVKIKEGIEFSLRALMSNKSKELEEVKGRLKFGLQLLEAKEIWDRWVIAVKMAKSPEIFKLGLKLAGRPRRAKTTLREIFECRECGGPVDENNSSCTNIFAEYTYEPMNVGSKVYSIKKCNVCKGPLPNKLGSCPECGGMVFELDGKFACIQSIIGGCSFTMGASYVDKMILHDSHNAMDDMLNKGAYFYSVSCNGDDEDDDNVTEILYKTTLFHLFNTEWIIESKETDDFI